ncbi:hypothetical protein JL720_6855 [Aureococcus anophagefferens]|nr:hypothetical protein JL720_6855 [Aureococcus anophagefferens]
MPPSIAMEGYLEKRIQRPFGIVVWQKRHVMLTPSEIVVAEPAEEGRDEALPLRVRRARAVLRGAEGRVAFALLDAEEQETKLTLAAETKFEHGRWIRRRRGPGGRERRGAEAQGAAPAHGGVLRRARGARGGEAAPPLATSRPRRRGALAPAASRAVNAPAPAAAAKPGPAPGPVGGRGALRGARGAEARGAEGPSAVAALFARRAKPAAPAAGGVAAFVEVEFVRGPLGLMFDDLAGSSNRAVITGTTETGEHFASLKVGDEIAGVAGRAS